MFKSLFLPSLFAALAAFEAVAQVTFVEVSGQEGIDYVGPSFGASWGDFNGDGRPDLWVGSHGEIPRLYVSQPDGSFILQPGMEAYQGDNHGAAWADFDNDGDRDLLILNGAVSGQGSGPNNLLINSGGSLEDQATAYGIDYPLGRGRTPLWFDWNNDGRLDAFLANWRRADGQSPTAVFTNSGAAFLQDNAITGYSSSANNNFAQLGWSPAANRPLLMIHDYSYPEKILRFDTLPFSIAAEQFSFPVQNTARDVAVRDFNGDGAEDVFVVRVREEKGSELVNGELTGLLIARTGDVGAEFSGGGNLVDFAFGPNWRAKKEAIFIGAAGRNPDANSFQLAADDVENHGIKPHETGDLPGIYVGYDPLSAKWKVLASSSSWFGISYRAVGESAINSFSDINFTSTTGAQKDLMLQNISGVPVDVTAAANLDDVTSCLSVAAADFDNDMDVDLYVVCRGITSNLPNRLLLNDGNGVFEAVADAAGASGSAAGRGDSVAVADYDADGFVDIFVTNGLGDPLFNEGPDQLFRNLGNDNHWLEIDPVGIESNRDGIGARVEVLAGGVRQVQLVDGGMHLSTQNHARLHFGLAANTTVDEVVVNWPSGNRQVLSDVQADQLLEIRECAGAPSSPGTVYEDAEDGLTAGWDIYDANPAGASVSNVCDEDRGSRVIELSGSGLGNGYRLRGEDLSPWGNLSETTIEWSMNFAQAYTIYVDVATSAGQRYLTYTPSSVDDLGSGRYVRHGLGGSSAGGGWVTVVRDLQADLSEAQPGVVITAVNGFLVRGDGRLDDIQLRVAGTTYEDAEDGTTQGWDIYDANPSGAEILNVQDIDRGSRVIELSGSGLGNGYRLRGEDLSPWGNLSETTIEWSMNFAQAYTIYVDVATSAGQRYLTYTPSSVDDLGSGRYVRHGLGGSSAGGSWVTVVRDLQADLSEAQPGVVITAVNGFLVRGDGRLDDVRLLDAG